VPAATATQISHLPPVASLFAALLGFNPMASLLPPNVLQSLPAAQAAILTSKELFPQVISAPIGQGCRGNTIRCPRKQRFLARCSDQY